MRAQSDVFSQQPWLGSRQFDLAFIIGPGLAVAVLAFILGGRPEVTGSLPLWVWLLLIVGVDVSHVYSTLFRTYLSREDFAEFRTPLILIPICVWACGVVLYALGPLIFWRTLAYIAVFHFIRQQYGLVRLYSRHENPSQFERWIEGGVVYLATLFPIVFWHTHQPRQFNWFVEGDFVQGVPAALGFVVGFFYLVVAIVFLFLQLRSFLRGQNVNVPKNLVILSTALTWYIGIVLFDSDLIFTMTNVVAHGIPYMALIWIFKAKKTKQESGGLAGERSSRFAPLHAGSPGIHAVLFIGFLLLLAYIEEGLWAGFVWREHLEAFGWFAKLPAVETELWLTWLIPLLALPQATHYILDGFIWRVRDPYSTWLRRM